MRKEAKERKAVKLNRQQAYHNGDYSGEAYAANDFEHGFKVMASDRPREADGRVKAYGTEVELVSNCISNTTALCTIIEHAVYPMFPKGMFKQQHDGSLGGASSTELITLPMTKAFIRNNYNAFRATWDFLKAIGTLPDGSCGMHINVSMPCWGKDTDAQKAAVVRFNNFIYDNFPLACALFKRDRANVTYCRHITRAANASELPTYNDHHAAMNYSHMNAGTASRVEIRLVGPQRTFAAFRNTWEVVFHLVEAAKDGRDFTSPIKLWAGCNECVVDRLADVVAAGLMDERTFNMIKEKSINGGIREATR